MSDKTREDTKLMSRKQQLIWNFDRPLYTDLMLAPSKREADQRYVFNMNKEKGELSPCTHPEICLPL